MTTLCVTSLSTGAGKTTISAGLAIHWQAAGRKIGYLKVVLGATSPNTDGQFMKELLLLPEAADANAPAFVSESQLYTDIRGMVEKVAADKDIVLVECSSENAVGIAKAVAAKIIVVADYSEMATVSRICKPLNACVVINKVPVSQLGPARVENAVAFRNEGLTVAGILPENRTLLTFTVADLVKTIDGQLLNNPEKASETVENVMLGAMTVDSGLPYYSRKSGKAVVVRAGRPDMAMAALETPTRALVLAGKAPAIPQVRNKAEDKGIPVVTTELDVQTVATRLENAVLKIRFNQQSKLPEVLAMMNEGMEFAELSRFTGIR